MPWTVTLQVPEIQIGRVNGHNNAIVLPKGNVSKRHCRLLVAEDGAVSVMDVNSTNGTWVNGRKVRQVQPFGMGDQLFVGDFVVELAEPPSAV